jgi:hypothetical protein
MAGLGRVVLAQPLHHPLSIQVLGKARFSFLATVERAEILLFPGGEIPTTRDDEEAIASKAMDRFPVSLAHGRLHRLTRRQDRAADLNGGCMA